MFKSFSPVHTYPCKFENTYETRPDHSIGIYSRFTQQCNVVFCVYADLCSLLAANSQFSILIGQKMQLTGCHNGNEMRNATCVDTKISIEWPYCSFLYCDLIMRWRKDKPAKTCTNKGSLQSPCSCLTSLKAPFRCRILASRFTILVCVEGNEKRRTIFIRVFIYSVCEFSIAIFD